MPVSTTWIAVEYTAGDGKYIGAALILQLVEQKTYPHA